MRFMNEYDISRAEGMYRHHPILGPAVRTLRNLADWTNANSDGWAYWPKPTRAAARLMELIERDGTWQYVGDEEREDVTEAEYRAALRPIKAFRTRQGASFDIIEIGANVKTFACAVCGGVEFEKRGERRTYHPLGPDLSEDGWNHGDITMDTTDEGDDIVYCVECHSETTEEELRGTHQTRPTASRPEHFLRVCGAVGDVADGEVCRLPAGHTGPHSDGDACW